VGGVVSSGGRCARKPLHTEDDRHAVLQSYGVSLQRAHTRAAEDAGRGLDLLCSFGRNEHIIPFEPSAVDQS
jgi:hypothetical protein